MGQLAKLLQKLKKPGTSSTFSFLVIEYLLRFTVGFGMSIWMARALGGENFGLFSYVISLVTVFTPFYTMGMEEIPTKDLIINPNEHDEILGTSFLIKLLGGFAGNLLCFIIVSFLHRDDIFLSTIIMLYAFSMLFKSLQVIENYYLSKQNIKKISISRNLIFLLVSLVKFYFLFIGKSWEWFVYASILEVSLFGVIYCISYRHDGFNPFKWKVSKVKRRNYYNSSILLFLITFLTMGIAKIDQIMIKNIHGNFELGQYAVGVKLVEIWQFAPLAMISALFPKIVESREKGGDEYQKSLSLLYAILLGFSLVLSIGATLIGPNVIDILYGSEYQSSGKILVLYCWTTVLSYFSLARIKVFVIENILKEALKVTLVTLVLNIIYNYFLISKYGAIGAVGASFGAYLTANIVMSLFNENIKSNFIDYFSSVFTIKKVMLKLFER